MKQMIEVSLEDGNKVYLEIEDSEGREVRRSAASAGRIIKKTKEFLDNSAAQIGAFSNSFVQGVKSADLTPDEFEIDFTIKFSADMGVVFSSAGAETGITVKLKWNKLKEEG